MAMAKVRPPASANPSPVADASPKRAGIAAASSSTKKKESRAPANSSAQKLRENRQIESAQDVPRTKSIGERRAETIERALEDASIERALEEASKERQRISPQVALLLAAGASALKTPCPLYAPTSPRVCTLAMG